MHLGLYILPTFDQTKNNAFFEHNILQTLLKWFTSKINHAVIQNKKVMSKKKKKENKLQASFLYSHQNLFFFLFFRLRLSERFRKLWKI